MPYKTEKLKLDSPFLSRRVKLLPCQKEMVCWWYANTEISIGKLAKLFKVSKRTIQFILFPDRKKKNIELRNERGGSKIYYNRQYHNQKIKEHRQYKHKVLKEVS